MIAAAEANNVHRQVGIKLRMAREVAGLTQQELAKVIGVSRAQVVNMEQGRSGTTIPMLLRWSNACGMKAARLLP